MRADEASAAARSVATMIDEALLRAQFALARRDEKTVARIAAMLEAACGGATGAPSPPAPIGSAAETSPQADDLRRIARAAIRSALAGVKRGDDGGDGAIGPMPQHQWSGSRLRFERPDGVWGEWVDLQGPPGPGGGGFPSTLILDGNSEF